MSLSQFSPESFLDATLTEPSVRRPPLAVQDYNAVIKGLKARAWQGKEDTSRSGIAIDVQIEVDVPVEQQAKIGQPKVVLGDSIMLDVTENGAIDNSPGKNRRLRQYRDALDMNKPGDAFNFRMMEGRMIKVKVKHEVYQGDTLDKIEAVAKS